MGFNNGYDAGYADCETDNRKRWEAEAFERGKAAGGGSSSGKISLSAMSAIPIYQLVASGDEPKFDQQLYPVRTYAQDPLSGDTYTTEDDNAISEPDAFLLILEAPIDRALHVLTDIAAISGDVTLNGSPGAEPLGAGLYYAPAGTADVKVGLCTLDALVP